MYKISYYLNGGNTILFKWFKTLGEATEFGNNQPINSVLEIKYYPEENKRENRT